MQRFRDAGRTAAEKSKAAAKGAADAAASAAGGAQEGADKALNTTGSAVGDAIGQLKSMSVDRVFPECPAPAFMMPTGPGVEDYVIVFDLDEITDKLRSGLLVRPQIEVWSGKTGDYDLEHFGQELVQDFVQQFDDAREGLTQAYQPGIDALEAQRSVLSGEIRKEATGSTLTSAARWTFIALFTPPLFLLLLSFGMRPRMKLVGLVSDYLRTGAEKRRTQEELDREVEELESQFSSKNRTFERAVKKIEVREHPEIRRMARLINGEKEAAQPPGNAGPESGDAPDIQRYFRHPRYLERLPERYRQLLPA